MTAREDFERAIDRAVIWKEAADIAERQLEWATADAAYLTAPRVQLLDEQRRIVRVVNAPPEARRHPPAVLHHWWDDTLGRRGFEPVARCSGQPNPRDLDYVVSRTRAGDALLELLRDDVEPSAVVNNSKLVTSFEA